MKPRLAAIDIALTPPATTANPYPATTWVNVTDPDAARSGQPSAFGRITWSRSSVGPVGGDQPAMLTLKLNSSDPQPWPQATKVQVLITTGTTPAYLASGWLDEDTVDVGEWRGTWSHQLNVVDVIDVAANRAAGITMDEAPAFTRVTELVTGNSDILQAEPWGGGHLLVIPNAENPIMAAESADTSILDVLRKVATARSRAVRANGFMLDLRPMAGDYSPAWWTRWTDQQILQIDRRQLSHAPATTSRASRASKVTVSYVNGTTADATEIDAGVLFPSTLTLDTGIQADDPISTEALTWLTHVATTIAHAEARPVLGATTLLHDFTGDPTGAKLNALLTLPQPLIQITPAPSHADGWHIVDGRSVTIDPDLTLTLTLTLTPATLYGLRAPRHTDFDTSHRFPTTAALPPIGGNSSSSRWTRFTDLQCVRPPT